MTDIRSEGQDYLYISSDYQPKNRQEATIWWMKCFAGQFLLLLLKTDNFYERLEQADISFNQLDPLLKWDNDTLFNVLLDRECYGQATRFIRQMSSQPHFDDMLNLTNPKAGVAIQKLFDYAADEKIPLCMKNEHEAARKQKLRQALCEVVSPAYIAQLAGKTGETDFSAALKLKMTAPSVIIPVLKKLRNTSQDEI
ncbi:MAG: hypothetical protein ACI4QM_00265, partial [Alphaproteobacteria bacterium]